MEEINRLKSKLESEREGIKVEERRLKEESWKLKDIEQQLMMQNKYFQKLLNVCTLPCGKCSAFVHKCHLC